MRTAVFEVFYLPVAIPQALLLPFQIVADLAWLLETAAASLASGWPRALLGAVLAVEGVTILAAFLSKTVSANVALKDRLRNAGYQLGFVASLLARPAVDAALARFGENSRLGRLMTAAWWALAVAGVLSHVKLLRDEYGEGDGAYERSLDAVLGGMGVEADVDTLGLMAAAFGLLARSLLLCQVALARTLGQDPWSAVSLPEGIPPLTSSAPW